MWSTVWKALMKAIVVTKRVVRRSSGKVMRRLLRARELGLPEGDLSTLEGGAG